MLWDKTLKIPEMFLNTSQNKNVQNLFMKFKFKKLLSVSHREALCARPGTRESNETGGLVILKELLTLPMLSL